MKKKEEKKNSSVVWHCPYLFLSLLPSLLPDTLLVVGGEPGKPHQWVNILVGGGGEPEKATNKSLGLVGGGVELYGGGGGLYTAPQISARIWSFWQIPVDSGGIWPFQNWDWNVPQNAPEWNATGIWSLEYMDISHRDATLYWWALSACFLQKIYIYILLFSS